MRGGDASPFLLPETRLGEGVGGCAVCEAGAGKDPGAIVHFPCEAEFKDIGGGESLGAARHCYDQTPLRRRLKIFPSLLGQGASIGSFWVVLCCAVPGPFRGRRAASLAWSCKARNQRGPLLWPWRGILGWASQGISFSPTENSKEARGFLGGLSHLSAFIPEEH